MEGAQETAPTRQCVACAALHEVFAKSVYVVSLRGGSRHPIEPGSRSTRQIEAAPVQRSDGGGSYDGPQGRFELQPERGNRFGYRHRIRIFIDGLRQSTVDSLIFLIVHRMNHRTSLAKKPTLLLFLPSEPKRRLFSNTGGVALDSLDGTKSTYRL